VVDGALLPGADGHGSADDNATGSITLSLLTALGRRAIAIIALIICACAVLIIAFLLATVCLVRRRRHRYHKVSIY